MKVNPEPEEGPTLVIPTQDDFQGLAMVEALAFKEKNACCCFQGSLDEAAAENLRNLNTLRRGKQTRIHRVHTSYGMYM